MKLRYLGSIDMALMMVPRVCRHSHSSDLSGGVSLSSMTKGMLPLSQLKDKLSELLHVSWITFPSAGNDYNLPSTFEGVCTVSISAVVILLCLHANYSSLMYTLQEYYSQCLNKKNKKWGVGCFSHNTKRVYRKIKRAFYVNRLHPPVFLFSS
jgi:hypothetical protein